MFLFKAIHPQTFTFFFYTMPLNNLLSKNILKKHTSTLIITSTLILYPVVRNNKFNFRILLLLLLLLDIFGTLCLYFVVVSLFYFVFFNATLCKIQNNPFASKALFVITCYCKVYCPIASRICNITLQNYT